MEKLQKNRENLKNYQLLVNQRMVPIERVIDLDIMEDAGRCMGEKTRLLWVAGAEEEAKDSDYYSFILLYSF